MVLKKIENGCTENNVTTDKEPQVGYYHILATDLEEAIKMVKENPAFGLFHQQQLK